MKSLLKKGKILSIDSDNHYLNCSNGNAKIEAEAKLFADCPSCKVKQKFKACKPNMKNEIKAHITIMFKSHILTVVQNTEQMTDNSLSEALL